MDSEEQNQDQETVQKVSASTSDLTEGINAVETRDEKINLIKKYLASCYQPTENGHIRTGKNILSVTFDDQFQWINSQNCRQNLDEDSASNLIVFDFFTHCCINCIHSIEDLRSVYNDITSKRSALSRASDNEKFTCGFKIISIHSPKFTTEKQAESITSSVQRMKLDHTEVINDPNMILWTRFGVYCWPTIMVFGPNLDNTQRGPNLLFVLTGEGHRDILQLLCDASLTFFDDKLSTNQVREYSAILGDKKQTNNIVSSATATTKNDQVDSGLATMLKFPGKVTSYHELICISDSGNNRIIICDLAGEIQHIIGGTESGYQDGDFTSARFHNPQGTAFQNNDVFFIADTGNHCIRQVDLKEKTVSSLVRPNQEIGEQKLILKSPWDLSFYGPEVLLVAAAGNHQIFGYFFEQLLLFRVDHPANTFDLVAGSGREENRNNMYILKSSFAQPSGIACSQGINENDKIIYIADSESSSIRFINSGGRVMPLVGGSRDPANLFCYGDEDGISYDVKFQHPMGVCSGMGASKIFVADTYNHKIKMINVETKHCTTLIGDGTAKNQLGVFTGNVKPKRLGLAHPSSTNIAKSSPLALLNEPGGLSIDDKYGFLYIADTNNHCIKVGHLHEKIVSELILKVSSATNEDVGKKATQSKQYAGENFDQEYKFDISKKVRNFNLLMRIKKIPKNFEGGNWKLICPVFSPNPTTSGSVTKRVETDDFVEVTCEEIPFVPWMREVYCIFSIVFCGQQACYKKTLKFLINLDCTKGSQENENPQFEIEYQPTSNDVFGEL